MDIQIPGYTLKKQLGKGGMALVYLGHQNNMDREVAIKILTPKVELEQSYAERFLQEARTVATLNHPHIIPVYDVGQVGDHYYIVMEYLPALTLSHWIKVGLEEQEVLNVVQQIASALYYSHSKGIIHRDIKPDNIMFREDGSAVLMDFGIARSQKSTMNMTQEGQMIGTPTYMSPEQARGQLVDARSDIYSLGVVMFEMLTKRQPYDAEDAIAIALKHVTEPLPLLPDHLSQHQDFINRMMAKDPKYRFQNGLELSKAVKQVQAGSGRGSDNVKAELIADPVVLTEDVAETLVAPKLEEGLLAESLGAAMPEEIALMDHHGEKVPAKNLEVAVEVTRKALIFKRSEITINLVSDDISQFNVQIGQVGERLLDWYAEYGGKAKAVCLNFYCKPWLKEPIEKSLRQMIGTKDPYGFLKKMDISVTICDRSGKTLVHYAEF